MCSKLDNLTLVDDLYFQISFYKNILINLDLFPKNGNEYFVALPILVKWMAGINVTNLTATSQSLLHVLPMRNNQVTWPQDVPI